MSVPSGFGRVTTDPPAQAGDVGDGPPQLVTALLDSTDVFARSAAISQAAQLATIREAIVTTRRNPGVYMSEGSSPRVEAVRLAARAVVSADTIPVSQGRRAARERIHPKDRVERHEDARRDRHVEVEPADDSMAWWSLYTDAASVMKFDVSDIDHRIEWSRGGVTNVDDLTPLSLGHHTVRHKTKITVTRAAVGRSLWRMPTGFERESGPPPF